MALNCEMVARMVGDMFSFLSLCDHTQPRHWYGTTLTNRAWNVMKSNHQPSIIHVKQLQNVSTWKIRDVLIRTESIRVNCSAMAAAEKSMMPLWSTEFSQPESSSSDLSSCCSRSADPELGILWASGKTEPEPRNSEFGFFDCVMTIILVRIYHFWSCYYMCWRITFCLEPLEQVLSLPSQRAEVGLAANVVMNCRADRQVIQQQPEPWVQRRVPQVLAVLIQPCLDKGQKRAGEAVEKSLQVNCWRQKRTWGRFKHNWIFPKKRGFK